MEHGTIKRLLSRLLTFSWRRQPPPLKLAGLYADIYSVDVRPLQRKPIDTASHRHSPDPECPCHDCEGFRAQL